MSDIFISYAREDRLQADHLARGFEARGWSVFWDRNIPTGKEWRSFVGKALEEARCVVVLWSASSVESHWVQEEADDGRQRSILVPVLLEEVSPPIGFRSIQAANLVGWDGMDTASAFTALALDVAAMLSPNEASRNQRLEVSVEVGRREGEAMPQCWVILKNVSAAPVEVTEVWYEDEKHNIQIRPEVLPVIIQPGKSWITWMHHLSVPTRYIDRPYEQFRARISNGQRFLSRRKFS